MSRQTKICNYEGTPDRARPRGTSWSRNSSRLRGKCSTAGFEHGRWQLVHTATGKRCVHHALPDVGFFPQNPYWGERCASGLMRTSEPVSSTTRPTRPSTTYLLLNPRGRLLETKDDYESRPLRSSQTVPTPPRRRQVRRQGLRP